MFRTLTNIASCSAFVALTMLIFSNQSWAELAVGTVRPYGSLYGPAQFFPADVNTQELTALISGLILFCFWWELGASRVFRNVLGGLTGWLCVIFFVQWLVYKLMNYTVPGAKHLTRLPS